MGAATARLGFLTRSGEHFDSFLVKPQHIAIVVLQMDFDVRMFGEYAGVPCQPGEDLGDFCISIKDAIQRLDPSAG